MVNQELFSDCQLQVWAVTSISQLAVASYTEDTYGVVQRVRLFVVIEDSGDNYALFQTFAVTVSNNRITNRLVTGNS